MDTKFTVSEALSTSWQYVKSNIFILVGLLVGYTIISSIISLVIAPLTAKSIVGSIIVTLVSIIIASIFGLGYTKNLFQSLDGEEPQFSAYQKQISKLGTYIIASIIYTIIVTIGMLLFILPGIYLALRLQFFMAFIVEENTGAIDSLKRSWEITNGQVLPLFLLALVMVGLIIAGTLLLVVGLFVAAPVVYMMYCYVFRKLNTNHEHTIM